MPNLLKEGFERLAAASLPKNCSAQQRGDLEAFFMAGAWEYYNLVMGRMSDGPNDQPEDLQLLSDLDVELRNYWEDLRIRGKAI